MSDWQRHKGGRGWRVLDDGRIAAEEKAHSAFASVDIMGPRGFVGYIYRTHGHPSSMEICAHDYWNDLAEARDAFSLPIPWIMATIAIEATRLAGTLHFDPQCERYEKHIDDWSAGLMQTLLSTAQEINHKTDLPRPHTRHDLKSPRMSIMHGAAYMRKQLDRYGQDPILACVAAYNAGSVREDNNAWNLRTYSDHRVDKWIAFQNDARTLGDA